MYEGVTFDASRFVRPVPMSTASVRTKCELSDAGYAAGMLGYESSELEAHPRVESDTFLEESS